MVLSRHTFYFSGLALFIFLILPFSARAVTFNVDGTNGTDTVGCGTGANPDCKTIGYAAEAAGDGDTISVEDGTYDEQLDFALLSNSTKQLIFEGDGDGNSTKATLTYTTGAQYDPVVALSASQNSTTILRNFTISCSGNIADGVGLTTTGTPLIHSNTVTGCGGSAIDANVSSGTLTIRNNTLQNSFIGFAGRGGATFMVDSNIISGHDESGITIRNGTFYVVNNVLYNNGDGDSAVDAAIAVQDLSGQGNNVTAVILNNTLDGNYPMRLTDTESSGGTVTAYHKNNIVVNSVGQDISINDFMGNPVSLISDYNFYDAFTAGELPSSNWSSLAAWQAATDDDDNSIVDSSPGFTDSANRDYTLLNTSLAIGRGTDDIVGTDDLTSFSANFDFDDNDRPEIVSSTTTLVDIGAYENVYTGELLSIAITSSAGTTLDDDDSSTKLTATGTYTAFWSGLTQDLTSLVTLSSSDNAVVSVNGRYAYGVAASGSSDITTSYGPTTGPAGSTITSSALTLTNSGLPGYKRVFVDAASGNDNTGSGSKNAPFVSLAFAQTQITGGERVYLSGTFSGTLSLTSADSGTTSANTWITNWSDHPTVTTGTILAQTGDNYAIQLDGTDYVTIQGLRIAGANGSTTVGAIDPRNGVDYLTVNSNSFDGNQIGMMNATTGTAGTNHTYSNNTLFSLTTMGIGVSNITSSTIYNNLIRDVTGIGIGFLGTTDTIGLWNNTLANNTTVGIGAYDTGDGAPTVTNLTARNNLVHQGISSLYGPPLRMTSAVNTGTGNLFDYNLYYVDDFLAQPLVRVDDTNYTTLASWQAASTHDDNSVSGDPLFTDVSGKDFTLQATSPAINAGTSSGAPSGAAAGLAGVTRQLGYDIGAYEVTASAPTAPSGLTADSVGTGGFTLTWTDNSDYAGDEDNFVIKQATVTNDVVGVYSTIATVAQDVTTYSVSDLSASATYSFTVDAVNTLGTGSSSALSVTTAAGGSARHSSGNQPDPSNDNTVPASDNASEAPARSCVPLLRHGVLATQMGLCDFGSLGDLWNTIQELRTAGKLFRHYLDFNDDGAFSILDLLTFVRSPGTR